MFRDVFPSFFLMMKINPRVTLTRQRICLSFFQLSLEMLEAGVKMLLALIFATPPFNLCFLESTLKNRT